MSRMARCSSVSAKGLAASCIVCPELIWRASLTALTAEETPQKAEPICINPETGENVAAPKTIFHTTVWRICALKGKAASFKPIETTSLERKAHGCGIDPFYWRQACQGNVRPLRRRLSANDRRS